MEVVRVHPLGCPVDLASDSTALLEAAKQHWEEWPALFSFPPLRFDLECEACGTIPEAPGFQISGGTLLLSSRDGAAAFSTRSQRGWLHLQGGHISQEQFIHDWLQPWILTPLDMLYFEPLHAACVAKNGRGILLCGDSGSGKTTLAYVCARSGWTVISEDGVRLAGEAAGQKLVGGRWMFHLREPARTLFPELASFPAAPTLAGKRAVLVAPQTLGFSVAHTTPPGPVVFLRRRPGDCRVVPFDQAEAVQYFLQTSKNPDRDASECRIRALLHQGCFALEYEDPWRAAAMLETLW